MITKTITLDKDTNFKRVRKPEERSQVGDVITVMQGTLIVSDIRHEKNQEIIDVITLTKPINE